MTDALCQKAPDSHFLLKIDFLRIKPKVVGSKNVQKDDDVDLVDISWRSNKTVFGQTDATGGRVGLEVLGPLTLEHP